MTNYFATEKHFLNDGHFHKNVVSLLHIISNRSHFSALFNWRSLLLLFSFLAAILNA